MKKIAIIIIYLLSFGTNMCATDASNEWSTATNKVLSHQIKVTSKDEIQFSSLNGFIELSISKDQKRYLPISKIKEINRFNYGVYITFESEVMKNGRGTMITVIYIPSEIISPNVVIDKLRNILK